MLGLAKVWSRKTVREQICGRVRQSHVRVRQSHGRVRQSRGRVRQSHVRVRQIYCRVILRFGRVWEGHPL